MEENLHQVRDNLFTIIDIRMDFLASIEYNKIMEKVRNKMSALTEDFMEGLYYDREEYINQISYEEGKNQTKIEIAKNLLNKKMNLSDISEITGLTKEEIEKL